MIAHTRVGWLRLSGICHAIAADHGDGWYHTGCQQFICGGTVDQAPQRKCRKCVEVLKVATLSKAYEERRKRA
jgi:hypothetical protein